MSIENQNFPNNNNEFNLSLNYKYAVARYNDLSPEQVLKMESKIIEAYTQCHSEPPAEELVKAILLIKMNPELTKFIGETNFGS